MRLISVSPKSANLAVLVLSLIAGVLIPSAAKGMYDPKHGRWLQRDPLGVRTDAPRGSVNPQRQFVDGTSLYQYVRSMPTVAGDPLGQQLDPGNSYQFGTCGANYWRDFQRELAGEIPPGTAARNYVACLRRNPDMRTFKGGACGCRSCRRITGVPVLVGHTWIECNDGTVLDFYPSVLENKHLTYSNDWTWCTDLTFAGGEAYPVPTPDFVGPPVPKCTNCSKFKDCMKREMDNIRSGCTWPNPTCIGAKNRVLSKCGLSDGWN